MKTCSFKCSFSVQTASSWPERAVERSSLYTSSHTSDSATLGSQMHPCALLRMPAGFIQTDLKVINRYFQGWSALFFFPLLPVAATLLYLLRMRGRKRAINVLGEAAARPLKRWKTNSVPSSVFITDTSRIGYWAPRFITNESLTAPRIKAITHWVPESATKSFPALEIYFNPLASIKSAERLPEVFNRMKIRCWQLSLEVIVHLYHILFVLHWAKRVFA